MNTSPPVNPGLFDDVSELDELLRRSMESRGSSEYVRFLNFLAAFDHYSRFNTMLVYAQNPEVTFFGSASYWRKKFNRNIKPDARPLIILAPMHPVLLVYDVYDTTGSETPQRFLEQKLGGMKLFEVRGTLTKEKFQLVNSRVTDWGIQVTWKPLSFFKAGFIRSRRYEPLQITLKEGEPIEANFTTLIHELAHLFLGHLGEQKLQHNKRAKEIMIQSRKLETNIEEIEAESVSFLVSRKLGLEARSAEYIGSYIQWSSDLRLISYEAIIRATEKIERLFIE